MASDIHGVLLVPHEGDPLGFLREGPCGARPPMAVHLSCDMPGHAGAWVPSGAPFDPPETLCDECSRRNRWPQRRVLVLAWGGEVVPEGVDRLARCGQWARPHDTVQGMVWGLLHARRAAVRQLRNKGTIIFLGADGGEVKP